MKKITEEQIRVAARLKFYSGAPALELGIAQTGFEHGVKWMQEQLQPEWITVSGIADLPTDDERYLCEVGDRVLFLNGNGMRFYRISRYTPVLKPVPPKQ